jgi:hypothetical protein
VTATTRPVNTIRSFTWSDAIVETWCIGPHRRALVARGYPNGTANSPEGQKLRHTHTGLRGCRVVGLNLRKLESTTWTIAVPVSITGTPPVMDRPRVHARGAQGFRARARDIGSLLRDDVPRFKAGARARAPQHDVVVKTLDVVSRIDTLNGLGLHRQVVPFEGMAANDTDESGVRHISQATGSHSIWRPFVRRGRPFIRSRWARRLVRLGVTTKSLLDVVAHVPPQALVTRSSRVIDHERERVRDS